MPIYLFEHPETKETIELVQGMSDKHSYVDKNGLEWRRVFTPSIINIDGKVSAWNSKDFSRTTENKNYTLGEMWDKSAELSAQRAEKNGGIDPVKQNAEKEYSKKRKGAKYVDGGRTLLGGGDVPTVEFTD